MLIILHYEYTYKSIHRFYLRSNYTQTLTSFSMQPILFIYIHLNHLNAQFSECVLDEHHQHLAIFFVTVGRGATSICRVESGDALKHLTVNKTPSPTPTQQRIAQPQISIVLTLRNQSIIYTA